MVSCNLTNYCRIAKNYKINKNEKITLYSFCILNYSSM